MRREGFLPAKRLTNSSFFCTEGEGKGPGENLKWLKEGTINFLIGQDAAVQGHSPVIILFQLLFDSKAPEKEYQYTDIVIRTKYNMG